MNITDFCNKHGILWQPVDITLQQRADGKTEKIYGTFETSPLYQKYKLTAMTTDFAKFSPDVIKQRQALLHMTDFIAIDTNVVNQIDIDEEIPDEFESLIYNTPHYKSITKGLPHIFVNIDGFEKNKTKHIIDGDDKLEYMCGQWCLAHKDAVVENCNKDIMMLTNNFIKRLNYTKSSPSTPSNERSNSNNEMYTELLFDIIKNDKKHIDYREWMKIGAVMKTRLDMSVDDFLRFTDDPINADKTKEHWERFNDKGVSPEYLWKIAKNEHTGNLDKFIAWKKKWNKTITPDILARGSNDICIFMTPILSIKLKFCENSWWHCNRVNIWEQLFDPTAIIVSAIQSEIDDLAANNSKKLMAVRIADDKDAIAACEKLEKDITKWRVSVSSCSQAAMYKNLLKKYLEDKDFINKLNCTIDKIVFNNGIYDLTNQQFTAGFNAHDYISDTLGFEYQVAEQCDVDYVKEQIKKICNYNDKHCEYFLSKLGAVFTARSSEMQEFYNCTGQKACNGKSSIFEALTEIAPLYVGKMSSSSLELNNTKIHKDIAKWRGKRLMWIDELSPKAINVDLLKLIANGKPVPYEVMYGTTALMAVLFGLFIIGNNSIQLKTDKGFERRLRHMQFDSVFSFDCNKDNYNEKIFIANPSFVDDLVTKYKYALLQLIFSYSKKYYDRVKFEYPADWDEEKQEILSQADPFDMWFNDKYILDTKGTVSKYVFQREVDREFKNINVRDYFKRKGYNIKTHQNNFWLGFAIKPFKIDNEDTDTDTKDTDSIY